MDAFAWTALPPYGQGGGGVAGGVPVIWVIELYVTPFDRRGETWDSPEGSVISTLAAGQVIGFSILVNDKDLLKEAEYFWVPEALDRYRDGYADLINLRADFFLDGLLLPGTTGPEDTAVRSVSWGRIKAYLDIQ